LNAEIFEALIQNAALKDISPFDTILILRLRSCLSYRARLSIISQVLKRFPLNYRHSIAVTITESRVF
jgi:hypothetical protein